MKTKIYALRGDNRFVRYVGKTVRSLASRLCGHLKDAQSGHNTYKCNWIRSMLKRGLIPSITLLAETTGDGCKEEIAWIKYFRDGGVHLTNATTGGEGGKLSLRVRRKISEGNKGRIFSLETRQKISRAKQGHPVSEETRKKIRLGNATRILSPEAKKRMIAHVYLPEVRAKISASLKGRKLSSEVRRNMSLSRIGIPITLKHRLAIIAAKKISRSWERQSKKNGRWCKASEQKPEATIIKR